MPTNQADSNDRYYYRASDDRDGTYVVMNRSRPPVGKTEGESCLAVQLTREQAIAAVEALEGRQPPKLTIEECVRYIRMNLLTPDDRLEVVRDILRGHCAKCGCEVDEGETCYCDA